LLEAGQMLNLEKFVRLRFFRCWKIYQFGQTYFLFENYSGSIFKVNPIYSKHEFFKVNPLSRTQ